MEARTVGTRMAWRTGAITALVAVSLLVPAAAGDTAAKRARFGAKLNKQTQPSNAYQGLPCEPDTGPCTRVSMEAYGRPDRGHRAPKNGTIGKVRIIAGVPGSFRLQLARARANSQQAKVVAMSPRLKYQGQEGKDEGGPYQIEVFKVNLPVKKGDYLGVKAGKISFMRCSSGGPNILFFQPPLRVGGPFQTADETSGCWLLLEAIYKN